MKALKSLLKIGLWLLRHLALLKILAMAKWVILLSSACGMFLLHIYIFLESSISVLNIKWIVIHWIIQEPHTVRALISPVCARSGASLLLLRKLYMFLKAHRWNLISDTNIRTDFPLTVTGEICSLVIALVWDRLKTSPAINVLWWLWT